MEYRVIKRDDWDLEVIFQSTNKIEVDTVHEVLQKYHHYDRGVQVYIEEVNPPAYKDINEFISRVDEYSFSLHNIFKSKGIQENILYPYVWTDGGVRYMHVEVIPSTNMYRIYDSEWDFVMDNNASAQYVTDNINSGFARVEQIKNEYWDNLE